MRSRKTAAVLFVLLSLALSGFSTPAKSAPFSTVTHTIKKDYDTTLIADLDGTTQDEIICLALNQYHEARGSSEADIKAVGFSTRNRVLASESHSFCKVIWERGQYVWTTRSISGIVPKEKTSWLRMLETARDIVVNEELDDPTNGADSFYARRLGKPKWTLHSPMRLTIGAHVYVRLLHKV